MSDMVINRESLEAIISAAVAAALGSATTAVPVTAAELAPVVDTTPEYKPGHRGDPAVDDPIVVDILPNGRLRNAGGYFVPATRADFSHYGRGLNTGARPASTLRGTLSPQATAHRDINRWAFAHPEAARALASVLHAHVGRDFTYRDILAMAGIVPAREPRTPAEARRTVW